MCYEYMGLVFSVIIKIKGEDIFINTDKHQCINYVHIFLFQDVMRQVRGSKVSQN